MYELRASELGRCVKASAAILLGYAPLPTPEKMQVAYDRGNDHETAAAQAFRDEGWLITEEQDEVVICPSQDSPWCITGHLDGIIRHDTLDSGDTIRVRPQVWEAKAPAAWAKFRDAYLRNDWSDPLAHRYAWQISVYMLATRLEALVCCLDDGAVKTFGIEVPPFTLAEIEQRVGEIIGYAEGGLPGSCSQNDWPCPVAYLHETPEVEEDVALDEMVNFREIAREARDMYAGRIKKFDDAIRDHLAGTNRTTAASKVTFYKQKGATKWDDNRLDALFTEMGWDAENYRVTGKPSPRMKITKRSGGDEQEETGRD